MKSAFLLALILLAAPARAGMRSSRGGKSQRAEAEFFYQTGVNQYAYGRFPQALAAFQEALRRDPDSRAARIAENRVREELAMAATEKRTSAAPRQALRPDPGFEDDRTASGGVLRILAAGRALTEAAEEDGRLRAMQGRIAQLLAERRLFRERGRAFPKDAELHALARRLS